MNYSCLSMNYYPYLQLKSFRLTIVSLFAITLLTAVSLNSLILYSIWKNSYLHKPSYLLVANLALTNFLFGVIGVPFTVFTYLSYINEWTSIYCYMAACSHVIGYWLSSVSIYILILMSIDRLLAIRLKNRYRSFVTSSRVMVVTIPYWVGTLSLFFTLLLSNMFAFGKNIIVPCFLFVFLTTIIVCYSMSFYSLKKLTSSVSSSNQEPGNGTINFDVSQYRRSLYTMSLVLLATLLFYLPYFCASVAHSINNGKHYDQNSFSVISFKMLLVGELIVGMNSIVNPLLYLWRMQDIRQAVKSTVKRILRRKHQNHSGHGGQAQVIGLHHTNQETFIGWRSEV